MKKSLFLFASLMIVFSAFSMDYTRDADNQGNVKEKTMKVTIISHFDLASGYDIIPAPEYEVIVCTKGWFSGHTSHGGIFDELNSEWEQTSASFDFGTMTLTQYTTGVITMANGESVDYTSVSTFDAVRHAGTSVATITGGTGRYENAEGTIYCEAARDPVLPILSITGEGTISY